MAENTVIRNGSQAVVTPGGDLVAYTVTETRNEWKQLLAEGVTSLVVDRSRAHMVDSQGIGLFVALYNTLAKAGGTLSVTNASEDIEELFRSMRLDRHFSVTVAPSPSGRSKS